jgi:hypothetical protein
VDSLLVRERSHVPSRGAPTRCLPPRLAPRSRLSRQRRRRCDGGHPVSTLIKTGTLMDVQLPPIDLASSLDGLRVALAFMDNASNRFAMALKKTNEERYIEELWVRFYLWARTLAKLDEPQDFQAALAALRASTELVVDIVLAGNEPGAIETMRAWENVRTCQAGKDALIGLKRDGSWTPEQIASIDAYQESNWPKATADLAKHPEWKGRQRRWTGKGLHADLKRAHALLLQREPNLNLSELADHDVGMMSWFVHGSTLLGVSRIDTEPKAAMLLIKARLRVGQFAFVATREVYRYLKYDKSTEAMLEATRFEARFLLAANGVKPQAKAAPKSPAR